MLRPLERHGLQCPRHAQGVPRQFPGRAHVSPNFLFQGVAPQLPVLFGGSSYGDGAHSFRCVFQFAPLRGSGRCDNADYIGFPRVFQWLSYDFLMILCGFPTVFLWLSYGNHTKT